jgi:hypothetical protein
MDAMMMIVFMVDVGCYGCVAPMELWLWLLCYGCVAPMELWFGYVSFASSLISSLF